MKKDYMQQAINLCFSERNRWHEGDREWAHWNDIAALLQGDQLARKVRKAAPAPASPTAEAKCPKCGHSRKGDGHGGCAVEGCNCDYDRPVRRAPASPTARENLTTRLTNASYRGGDLPGSSLVVDLNAAIEIGEEEMETYAAEQTRELEMQSEQVVKDYNRLAKRANQLEHMMGEISMVLRKDIERV